MVFRKFGIFLLVLFFSFSVFAGVLKVSVENADDGVHGSKIVVSWFQGDDTLGLGPDQCGFDGVPGTDVPYVFKDSDSSFYPNNDSDPTGCNYCGGNSACNEGLDPGVEDYYCRYSDGACKKCNGICSSNADCGTGYSCNTSKGSCNAECVCSDALCFGSSECDNSGIGSSKVFYDGCSNGKCTSHTVTYECDGCVNKVCVKKHETITGGTHGCVSDTGCSSPYTSGKVCYYYVKECP